MKSPREFVGGGEGGVGEEQAAEAWGFGVFGDAIVAGADGVIEAEGDGDGGLLGAGIASGVAEDGAGEAGGVGVEGEDGCEGFKGRVSTGSLAVAEVDGGEGPSAGEDGGVESRQAGDVGGTEAAGTLVGRQVAGFGDFGDRLLRSRTVPRWRRNGRRARCPCRGD